VGVVGGVVSRMVVGGGAGSVVSGEEMLVLTDRDSDAGAPEPVAVNVTLCAFPSHGTAILPTPVTEKPAPAGSGCPSTEKLTACAFCVTQAADTATVPPLHVTSSRRSKRLIDGAVTGGGLFEVLTCRLAPT
jgi:hypothetical protein